MLTLKERLFVARYLATRNATQAAAEAYRCRNRNVAAVTGCRLLRNAKVCSEIDRILDDAGLGLDATIKRLKVYTEIGGIKGIKVALRLLGYRNI